MLEKSPSGFTSAFRVSFQNHGFLPPEAPESGLAAKTAENRLD
jgi:hypothetical protein